MKRKKKKKPQSTWELYMNGSNRLWLFLHNLHLGSMKQVVREQGGRVN